MPKVRFDASISFGTLVQIGVILTAVIGFFITYEVKQTQRDNKIQNNTDNILKVDKRVEKIENLIEEQARTTAIIKDFVSRIDERTKNARGAGN